MTTERAKALHKEHAFVHAQMVLAQTDKDRAEHARAIMTRIIPSLDKEYRDDPAPGAAPAEMTAEQLKKIQSLRSRISQLRKKQKQSPTQAAEIQKQIDAKQVELNQLQYVEC